jgi:transposase
MSIVGGLDIHRKQLTFDYVEVETGRLERGRIAPADREHLAGWLRRFDGVSGVAFAMEGCTGWRYVAEEMRNVGVEPHLAEPADTSALRGPKRRAKTDKADAQLLRELLATGRVPECYIPPPQVLPVAGVAGALPRSAYAAHRLGAACPRDVLPPGHHGAG